MSQGANYCVSHVAEVTIDMFKVNRPTVTEINGMNNATLKATLKDIIKTIEANEEAQQAEKAKDIPKDIPQDSETCELLKSILGELRKLTHNKEETDLQIKQLKESNDLLMQTITQQQRFLEEIDSERRSCNLIVLGVPEDSCLPTANGEGEASTDDEKFDEIMNKLGLPGPITPRSIQRLGKKIPTNTKPRPIKVVLENAQQRQSILEKAKTLNDATDAFKKIHLKKDVHPAVRREFGRLFAVEKAEKEKAENAGCQVVFDRQKRVVTIDGVIIDRFKPSFF